MIKEMTPINIAEAKEYLKKDGEEVKGFINKFSKTKAKDARELSEKLEKFDLLKIKPEHIIKIVDLMPEDEEDLNKIFTNVSLDEDETKKILDTVKEYK